MRLRKRKQRTFWIRPGDIVCDEKNRPVWMCIAVTFDGADQRITWWRLADGEFFGHEYAHDFNGWKNLYSNWTGYDVWQL